MDKKELEELAGDLECDRVERKASVSQRDRICEAICAFANDLPNHGKPGVVFVGVNDDGTCANLPITDDLLLQLAHLRSDGRILPFPSLSVQKQMLRGCEMAVVVVEPSDAPPVRYRGQVWVRVGPRRAIATAQDERILSEKRRAKDLPFDIRPVAAAALDDLDADLFRAVYLPCACDPEVLEQNARSFEHQLSSLRMATPPPESVPTALGILVLGRDPRQHIPGAYVQFLRIDGRDLPGPVKDQKEIEGPLPEVLRTIDEVLKAHIATASEFTTSTTEMRLPDYPLAALQQLVRNAILHRSYENTHAPVRITWFRDRIEIQSPGGPFGLVTRANFGRPGLTDYRNPHLAEAMKNLGYVQRFGMGIPIAQQELGRNGNPPAEFMVEDGYVGVVVRARP
jgi:ATP-dependent DNA helicase RecG